MKLELEIPEQYLADDNPETLARRLKLSAAIRMFQDGELSAGAASTLAGVDRTDFAAECRKRGIAMVDYDPAELAADLEAAREAG